MIIIVYVEINKFLKGKTQSSALLKQLATNILRAGGARSKLQV